MEGQGTQPRGSAPKYDILRPPPPVVKLEPAPGQGVCRPHMHSPKAFLHTQGRDRVHIKPLAESERQFMCTRSTADKMDAFKGPSNRGN